MSTTTRPSTVQALYIIVLALVAMVTTIQTHVCIYVHSLLGIDCVCNTEMRK